jgi:xanthine dehydrogenase accessory factor
MEQNIIAEAREYLQKSVPVRLCRKLHHFKHPQKTPSGLICAGSQTNILLLLTVNDLPVVRTITHAVREHTPIFLCASPDGLSVESLPQNAAESSVEPFRLEYFSEEDWSYRELLGAPHTAYIVGGGHVGLALSRQLQWLNFRVVVLDPRTIADTDTLGQNIFAERIITTPYTDIAEHIPSSERSYVVILTSAYPTDVQALVSLAGKLFRYIGIMGSRAKIATILREARAAGITEEWLANVRAPLGVQINSDTPEEIAVSIAAELIAVKNLAPKTLP